MSFCMLKLRNHLVIVAFLLLSAFASLVSRVHVFDAISFICVQFVFLYIPGYALQQRFGIRYENRLVRNLFSYATGYALTIFLYIALLIFSVHQYILYIYFLIFAISALYLFSNKHKKIDVLWQPKEEAFFIVLLLISFICGFFLFQLANISPALREGDTVINQDLLFWFRNGVAATKGYPLPDLSIVGKVFFYHYFTSVEIAFLYFTTGVEIYDLCFTYSYIITIFLTISGLYVISKSFGMGSKCGFIFITFVIFTLNLDEYTHIFFNHHVLVASFGFAEGLAFMFFTLYYYKRLLQSNEDVFMVLFFALLFFFVTTGLKGPVAAMLLTGIAMGTLYLMFVKHNFFYGAFIGIAFLVAFLIPLLFFVVNINGSVESGSSSELTLSATNTIFHSHYFENMFQVIIGVGINRLLAYLFVFVIYLCSVFMIPLLLCFILLKKAKPTDFLLVFMIFVGIILGLFVSQSGMSQGYFLYVSICLLYLLAFSGWKDEELTKKMKWRLIVVFGFGFFFFISCYAKSFEKGAYTLAHTIHVSKMRSSKVSHINSNGTNETGLMINRQEIEGLRWCRDHLPFNAVLLSNKVLADLGARSFWVSSLSERQTFFESYDYSNVSSDRILRNLKLITLFYQGDEKACKKIRNLGVTHAVCFKCCLPNRLPPTSNIVYENDKMYVLEL